MISLNKLLCSAHNSILGDAFYIIKSGTAVAELDGVQVNRNNSSNHNNINSPSSISNILIPRSRTILRRVTTLGDLPCPFYSPILHSLVMTHLASFGIILILISDASLLAGSSSKNLRILAEGP